MGGEVTVVVDSSRPAKHVDNYFFYFLAAAFIIFRLEFQDNDCMPTTAALR